MSEAKTIRYTGIDLSSYGIELILARQGANDFVLATVATDADQDIAARGLTGSGFLQKPDKGYWWISAKRFHPGKLLTHFPGAQAIKPWWNLKDYNLFLSYLRSRDGKALYAIITGDLDANQDRLASLGFRPNASGGFWFADARTISPVSIQNIFPLASSTHPLSISALEGDAPTTGETREDRQAEQQDQDRRETVKTDAEETPAQETAARPKPVESGPEIEERDLEFPASSTNGFHIPAADYPYAGTSAGRRYEQNLDAIGIISGMEQGVITELGDEEKRTLAAYCGWGAAANAFKEKNKADALSSALWEADLIRDLRRSTPNAHYTDPALVEAMWTALERMGFSAGTVLEPSAGNGVFLTAMPPHLRDSVGFVCVEKEPVAARILTALHPDAKVYNNRMEAVLLPECSVDAVIGNVPFGDFRVFDPAYPESRKTYIHNYFILKSLDALRPGGVAALITSTGTLDTHDPAIREEIYRHSDLVGVYRASDTAHLVFAGTEVTTDILFFRKRLPGEEPGPDHWLRSSPVQIVRNSKDLEGETEKRQEELGEHGIAYLNEVFHHHADGDASPTPVPAALGGDMELSRSMYGGWRIRVTQERGALQISNDELLREFIEKSLPIEICDPDKSVKITRRDKSTDILDDADLDVPDFIGYVVSEEDGKVSFMVGNDVEPVADREQKVCGRYVILRDAIVHLREIQLDGCTDEEWEQARAEAERAYDEFIKHHGPLNKPRNVRIISRDGYSDLVLASESYDPDEGKAEKASVYHERIFSDHANEVSVSDIADAVNASIALLGKMDFAWIAEKMGITGKEALDAAIEEGIAFIDPADNQPVHRDEYLSGPVKLKLEQAVFAANADDRFRRNVEALEAVIPRDKAIKEIRFDLGAPWLPVGLVQDFVRTRLIKHLADWEVESVRVEHSPLANIWDVEIPRFIATVRSVITMAGTQKTLQALVEGALNRRKVKVFKKDRGKSVLDINATELCSQKIEQIKDIWRQWVLEDQERVAEVEAAYNEKMRSHVNFTPSDDALVNVPDMNSAYQLREYQRKGMTRCIRQQNTLLGDPVGFGKTATMGGAALLLRRMGLARKSLLITTKATMYQIAANIQDFYPHIRTLVMEPQHFSRDGRRRFLAMAQMRNPDLIIMSKETLARIGVSKETEIEFLSDEIARQEASLYAAMANVEGNFTPRSVKQAEVALERMREKLMRLYQDSLPRDKGSFIFEELGVDAMFVDEAHYFKSLGVVTSRNVLGVPTNQSQRALDMLMKVRLLQKRDGRVIFATGTPITNTIAEAFVMQTFLQPDRLEEMGISHFDAWSALFAEIETHMEPDPKTSGYHEVERLTKVVNVGDLVRLFSEVASVPDRKHQRALVLPEKKHEIIEVEPTELQESYRKVLAARARLYSAMNKSKEDRFLYQKIDNVLVVLGDARRASLTIGDLYPALVDSVEVSPEAMGRKISAVVENLHQIYEETNEERGVQLVFCDLSVPGGKSGYSAYEEIVAGLLQRGIPREEIGIIHDCKNDQQKEELFRKCRTGAVRVVLASTAKAGEGMNIQNRLACLHELNAPFHPGHIIQRYGRIVRFGNMYDQVRIKTYVTKGLLEDWNWSLVNKKARFILEIMRALADVHTADEMDLELDEGDVTAGISFEEVEARATGNELALRKCELERDLKQAEVRMNAAMHERNSILGEIENNKFYLEAAQGNKARAQVFLDVIEAHPMSGASEMMEAMNQAQAEVKKAIRAEKESLAEEVKALKKTDEEAAKKLEEESAARFSLAAVRDRVDALAKDRCDWRIMISGTEYSSPKDAGLALIRKVLDAEKTMRYDGKKRAVVGEFRGCHVVIFEARRSLGMKTYFAFGLHPIVEGESIEDIEQMPNLPLLNYSQVVKDPADNMVKLDAQIEKVKELLDESDKSLAIYVEKIKQLEESLTSPEDASGEVERLRSELSEVKQRLMEQGGDEEEPAVILAKWQKSLAEFGAFDDRVHEILSFLGKAPSRPDADDSNEDAASIDDLKNVLEAGEDENDHSGPEAVKVNRPAEQKPQQQIGAGA